MDHISIPIPDGMDETQKAELTQWLSLKAAEASPERMPFEDDPEWRTEAAARIKRGMADVEAGRVRDASEVMHELADKHGLTLPE